MRIISLVLEAISREVTDLQRSYPSDPSQPTGNAQRDGSRDRGEERQDRRDNPMISDRQFY